MAADDSDFVFPADWDDRGPAESRIPPFATILYRDATSEVERWRVGCRHPEETDFVVSAHALMWRSRRPGTQIQLTDPAGTGYYNSLN